MPRRRRSSKARVSTDDLSGSEWLELVIGPGGQAADLCVPGCHDLAHDRAGGCPTAFRDAHHAASAWFAFAAEHGDAPGPGRRYAGWWRWVARRPMPDVTDEPAVLEAMGELEPWERHQLAAWRAIEARATDATDEPPAGGREDDSDA